MAAGDGYVKNVFNTTATGDWAATTQLTTNVLLTDPRSAAGGDQQFGEGDPAPWRTSRTDRRCIRSGQQGYAPLLWTTAEAMSIRVIGRSDPYVPPLLKQQSGSRPPSRRLHRRILRASQTYTHDQEYKITYQPADSIVTCGWHPIWPHLPNQERHRRSQAVALAKAMDTQPGYARARFVPAITSAPRADTFRFITLPERSISPRRRRAGGSHSVIDFGVGKMSAFALFRLLNEKSTVDLGVRIAQFVSKSSTTMYRKTDQQANAAQLQQIPAS